MLSVCVYVCVCMLIRVAQIVTAADRVVILHEQTYLYQPSSHIKTRSVLITSTGEMGCLLAFDIVQ